MKNYTFSGLILLFSALVFGTASYQVKASKPMTNLQPTQLLSHNKAFFFEENKGQLMDENHKVMTDIKYSGYQAGVYVYCKPGIISFVFTKNENEQNQISEATAKSDLIKKITNPKSRIQNSRYLSSRMDLVLIGSNPLAQISSTDQQEYYENFYTTGNADHGITNVRTYKTVTYSNIYPHIDMILNSKSGQGIEYSFLVHSGGKVSDIKLSWKGANKNEHTIDGGIKYSNTLGELKESTPKSFVNGIEIKSKFINKIDFHSFIVENYNKSKDLLIDPGLTWATYFGGSGSDDAWDVCTDISGNVFITGFTSSTNGIASSGAYQTTFGGAQDVFLAKFNGSGNLGWSTYYGGPGSDISQTISADPSGNIFVTGYTNSSAGIATSGSNQTSFGGGAGYGDAFLAKFSAIGKLDWGTYFGGSGDDLGVGLSTDASGNVYMGGQTNSNAGIATSGAQQSTFGGGANYGDGFLAKFNNSGTLSWATYFGGSSDDAATGVSADASGNVFLAGESTSNSGIATSGAYQTSLKGIQDAFLAKFSNAGVLDWSTYYGGIGNEDAKRVATDASGDAYITGYTVGSTGLATTGAYQTSNGGGPYDVFLAKFNSTGGLTWSTYYGGPGSDVAYGLSIDHNGEVFIAGSTNSISGIATSGSYQSTMTGYGAFLAEFSSSGELNLATYFGKGNESGVGVSVDALDNVYIIGNTGSASGIATSGAYQTSSGGSTDAYLAKFGGTGNGIIQMSSDVYGLNIYPNPFKGNATIKFTLQETAKVNIGIIDMMGNLVYTLGEKTLQQGTNEVNFNSSDINIAPGTYFLNLTINDHIVSKKIIELK